MGITTKSKQLRRFTILSATLSHGDGNLYNNSAFNRTRALERVRYVRERESESARMRARVRAKAHASQRDRERAHARASLGGTE